MRPIRNSRWEQKRTEGYFFVSSDIYPFIKKLGNVVILMYTDETVLVLSNPTLLKTLWQPLDVCSWLVYFGDGMLSP